MAAPMKKNIKPTKSDSGVGKKKVVVSVNEDTGNSQTSVTRKNLIGRPVTITKSKDEYGRKTKEKVSQNPYTGTVKVKFKTQGVKPSVAKYPGAPTKSKGSYKSPKGGEFNNQPKM